MDSSFIIFYLSSNTRRRVCVESACVFNCSLCVRRRIGEYISLEILVSEQLDLNVLSTALGIKKRKTVNRCDCNGYEQI